MARTKKLALGDIVLVKVKLEKWDETDLRPAYARNKVPAGHAWRPAIITDIGAKWFEYTVFTAMDDDESSFLHRGSRVSQNAAKPKDEGKTWKRK